MLHYSDKYGHVNKNKQSTVVSQYSKGQVSQEYRRKKYHFQIRFHIFLFSSKEICGAISLESYGLDRKIDIVRFPAKLLLGTHTTERWNKMSVPSIMWPLWCTNTSQFAFTLIFTALFFHPSFKQHTIYTTIRRLFNYCLQKAACHQQSVFICP